MRVLMTDGRSSSIPISAASERLEDVLSALESAVGISAHDLALHFDSLGPDCKLGLVQRACGAEPLGLTRFSSIPLAGMIKAPPRCFEWVVTSVSDHGWMFLGSAERRFSVPA